MENGTKAAVSSSGVTSEVPRAIEAFGSSGERMPIRCALATTFAGPTSAASWAATVLSDRASAVLSDTGPRYSRV